MDDMRGVPSSRERFFDYVHWIVVGHVVLEILGQQDTLLTVFAFNESLHVPVRPERVTSV
jgi:hypothetical protein